MELTADKPRTEPPYIPVSAATLIPEVPFGVSLYVPNELCSRNLCRDFLHAQMNQQSFKMFFDVNSVPPPDWVK